MWVSLGINEESRGYHDMRADQLTAMAEAAMAAHGLVLVQARLQGGDRYQTLQVLAEKPDGSSAGLDDYAAASRTLSAQLDVADAIPGKYVLEVSSPGLERPLLTPTACRRFVGRQVRVQLNVPQVIGGASLGTFSGTLQAATDADVTIAPLNVKAGTAPVRLPHSAIRLLHLNPSAEEYAAVMRGERLPGDVAPAPAANDQV